MDDSTDATPNANSAYALTHKVIGEIRGHFVVPGYQRGYRWDKHDVSRLLDDICGSDGRNYSLQPIVVKLCHRGKAEEEQEWELIDGQQRLTTLYLILQYMEREARCGIGAPYTLRYDTRPGSDQYLKTLEESRRRENIDFYHLYEAYQCISRWFQTRGDKFAQNNVALTIHGYLFKSVRVIWYNAANTAGAALFTRLNVGRIPLTDAELIKAALLSRVPERAIEIAAQWDGIERDLHRAEIWPFVAGLAAGGSDEQYPTRISLLLDSLADEMSGPPISKRPRYHTFDVLRGRIEESPTPFWGTVVALHAQILGWAELPSIYNSIGFLVSSGDSFTALSQAAKGKKKSEFDAFLLNRIRNHIKVKDGDLEDLHYEDKKGGHPKLMQLLLLMNVETTTQSRLRFPFARHVGHKWSLEHIHAQSAETLNKAEQWKIWLVYHKKALDVFLSESPDEIAKLQNEVDAAIVEINIGKPGRFSGERFNALSSHILQMLNRDDSPDHSIRNMALLSSADNSRLSNSVFEVKRQMILELDRKGAYVPVCTRNVFLKYYADADAQQPHFWSEADKESYLKEIRHRLKPYLIESPQKDAFVQ